MARNYSSIVEPKTLSADVPISGTNSDRVSISPNTDGLPTAPFVLVLNPDTSSEEVVLVTSQISGPTYAITRNIEGGGVKSHTVGQVVKHMIVGSDLQIVHDHFSNSDTATGTAHGATGGVVGRTNSQTLTNKTINLSNNTLTGTKAQFNAALSDADFATVTGTETLTGKTVDLTNNTLTGTAAQFNTALSDADFATTTTAQTLTTKTISLGSNTVTGTIAQFNTALSDQDFATIAGTETLTGKTLTSPTISAPTFTGTLPNTSGASLVPVGMIAPFAGAAAPNGWLLCAGQPVSRTTYAALYTALGANAYGTDTGSDFYIPDLRGRVLAGIDNMGGTDAGRLDLANARNTSGGSQYVTLTEAQMPVHSHANTVGIDGVGAHYHDLIMGWSSQASHDHAQSGISNPLPAMQADGTGSNTIGNYNAAAVTTSGSGHSHNVTISNASAGGSGGTTSAHSVLQPTMVINYIIKF